MSEFKSKAIQILKKFGYKNKGGKRHDKYIKKIITVDHKNHKIITHIERHRNFPKEKFETIIKQISLHKKDVGSALKCPYTKEMYEKHINGFTKKQLTRYGKTQVKTRTINREIRQGIQT